MFKKIQTTDSMVAQATDKLAGDIGDLMAQGSGS